MAKYHFKMYIAGNGSNSMQALANFKEISQKHFANDFEIEVIDVLRDPARALYDGVLITPLLIKASPVPECHIIGNLSKPSIVLTALGLPSSTF